MPINKINVIGHQDGWCSDFCQFFNVLAVNPLPADHDKIRFESILSAD